MNLAPHVLFAALVGAVMLAPPAYGLEGAKFPQFDGTVIAIDEPILLEYRSYMSRETTVTSGQVNDQGDPTEWSETLVADRTVQRRASRLERSYRVVNSPVDDAIHSLAAKELMLEISSDVYGGTEEGSRMKGWDAFAQKVGDPAAASEAARAQLLGDYQNDEALLQLPSGPRKSGDTIQSLPMETLLVAIGITGAVLPAEVASAAVKTTLKGYAYFDGRKVIVLSLWGDVAFDDAKSVKGSIVMGGFSLLDARTMATVAHGYRAMIDLEDRAGDKGRMKMTFEESLRADVTAISDRD